MKQTRSETGSRLGRFLYNMDYNVMYANKGRIETPINI